MRMAEKFIGELLEHPVVVDLENHEDLGIKVSIHTYDVLKSCHIEIIKEFKTYKKAKEKIDFFAIIIGVIIHDLSKGTLRKSEEEISHSQMMVKNPEHIVRESEKILHDVEIALGVELKDKIIRDILHIVVSHHGRWGKIQPGIKEAHIVHKADEYSAKYHRMTPVGADKILKLMAEGLTLDEVGKQLGCTQGILKDRLKKSKDELKIDTTKQLLNYYKKNKKIPLGDIFFEKRLKETEALIKTVEKKGIKNLVLQDELIKHLDDEEIFK